MNTPVDVFQISKLASVKGCTVRAMQLNETSIYWVENSHFIGKPYTCLNELARLIHALPETLRAEPVVTSSTP